MFGVSTYGMLFSHSPFRRDDEDKNFDVILEDELLYCITTSRDAVSILQKVCVWRAPHLLQSLKCTAAIDHGSQSSPRWWKGRCGRSHQASLKKISTSMVFFANAFLHCTSPIVGILWLSALGYWNFNRMVLPIQVTSTKSLNTCA